MMDVLIFGEELPGVFKCLLAFECVGVELVEGEVLGYGIWFEAIEECVHIGADEKQEYEWKIFMHGVLLKRC